MSRIVSEVNMPKLSGCFGFSRRAPRSATVASSIACGDLRDVARLDGQRQRAARSEHHLELAERDDRELVLRLAEQRAALRADADDAEVHAFDLDDLVERIDVAPNSRSAVCQPITVTGRARVDFGRAHQPAALGVEAREVDVVRR